MKKIITSLFIAVGLIVAPVACKKNNSKSSSENISTADSSISTTSSDNSSSSTSSSSSSTSSSNSSTGPVEPTIITAWATELIQMFNTYIGEVIPVAPITTDYEYEYAPDTYNIPVIIIYDLESEDITETYSAILEAAGYTLDEEDEGYVVYVKTVGDAYLCVEIDFPGDLFEEEAVIIYVYLMPLPFEYWPEEEIGEFVGQVGVIPEFEAETYQLTEGEDEYGPYLEIYGVTDNDGLVEEYASTLLAAGWEIDDSAFESDGVIQATYEDIYVYFYYDYDYGEFVLSISFIAEEDYETFTSWPTEYINDYVQIDVAIPSFAASEYYVWEESYEDEEGDEYFYLTICAETAESMMTTYENALIAAGWEMDYSIEDEGYINAFDTTDSVWVQFTYYEGYFYVYIEVYGDGSGTTGPVEGTLFQLVPNNFGVYADTSATVAGVTFSTKDVMKQANGGVDTIQFKKSTGTLSNTTALQLSSLVLKQTGGTGSVTVYAGTSAASINTKITGNNGVYNLTGYTFFKISNQSSNVAYFKTIDIYLVA